MRAIAVSVTLLLAACAPGAEPVAVTATPTLTGEPPVIIAHRGASGERPEHTLGAYALAIEQGADFIEPDLVLTKDGVLVARHENAIGETTDVADHPEFADRRATKTIDGVAHDDWFTEDFTLAELKTLRARERLPLVRPDNRAFDGRYEVPTFAEILALLKAHEARTGKRIGVYPETKHPSYFAGIGLPHEAPLLELLSRHGYDGVADPVFIQSFEVANLRELNEATDVRLVQLVASQGGPADGGDYAAMATGAGLAQIARYADAIGPSKDLVIANGKPTGLVDRAHREGLLVHPWTFRRENMFVDRRYWRGVNPRGAGDLAAELRAVIAAGVDGFFTDNPREAAALLSRDR